MIENYLIRFREAFHHTRVIVYRDYMTYRVRDGYADKVAKDANDLMLKLDLPLVAIPTKLSAKDSFVVKSSEVEL